MKAAMWLRCGDPDCSCQGAHDLPPLRSIDLIVHIPALDQTRQIHEKGTELDVIFDFFSGTTVLRQHVRKPHAWHESQLVTSIYFNQSNSTFINLEGLADNSLLLTFKYHSPPPPSIEDLAEWRLWTKIKRTKIRRRAHGFLPSTLNEGRLVHDIENETANEMILQLRIPHDRAMAWKTVALTLLAQRQIDCKTWHLLSSTKGSLEVAGFDWAEIKLLENSSTCEGYNPPLKIATNNGTGGNAVHIGQSSSAKESSQQQENGIRGPRNGEKHPSEMQS